MTNNNLSIPEGNFLGQKIERRQTLEPSDVWGLEMGGPKMQKCYETTESVASTDCGNRMTLLSWSFRFLLETLGCFAEFSRTFQPRFGSTLKREKF